MGPRSYFSTFCLIFSVTALPFAILMALITGTPIYVNVLSGFTFGLLFGLIMSALIRGETMSVTFTERQEFLGRLNTRLAEIGYNPDTQTDTFLTFKPSFQAGLLAGKISVQINDSSAIIVGPKMYLKKLMKYLSM